MIRPVHVLVYEHRHGMDLSAHASHESAFAALAQVAREGWRERTDREAPADCSGLSDEELVEACFEGHESEFYTLEAKEVAFPD